VLYLYISRRLDVLIWSHGVLPGKMQMGFFDLSSRDGVCEVRWHGRGGQGAITSAQHLAQAAYLSGFLGVTSAPSFGAERRGAPVTASSRLSHTPLRMFSQVEIPDMVVVLDETLLVQDNAMAGMKEGGWLIVNTPRDPESIECGGRFSVATADAEAAAREARLIVAGTVMVNTAMLGAVAKATGLINLDTIQATLEHKYPPKAAEKNVAAARLTFERTRILPCRRQ
jgi:pyruvate ferredoxin oxidoreductase gamma subunit